MNLFSINEKYQAGSITKPHYIDEMHSVHRTLFDYAEFIRHTDIARIEITDGLVVMTEWNEFKQLDLARIKESMKQPVIVDGRNLYDPKQMQALGFQYRGFGRGYNGASSK